MFFKDIVGQEGIKDRLIKSVQQGRIPHAQLFVGPMGTGKLPLAIAYAQYIMCENRGETDSCGVCHSCKKISKLVHPDLHFVYPAKSSEKKDADAENDYDDTISAWREQILSNPYFSEADWYAQVGLANKQGVISTAKASEVIRKLMLKSFESDYKVMIIWLPERMNVQSSNKLLKLIEEPPEKTVFLLVSENPNAIIKTILSRTQQIMIPPVSRESIALALTDRLSVTPEKAHDISRLANGSWYNAINLLNAKPGDYFQHYSTLMRLCYKRDFKGLIDWSQEVAGEFEREELKQFLAYSLKLTRESMVARVGLSNISYIVGEESGFVQKFSPYISMNAIQEVSDEFSSAYEHISQNGNPQIVLSHMAVGMARFISQKPED
ncbi:MAG TPA: DNA polymerase III subunit [Tenuifilaceae bacterium]|nr:DNA polymerase III subunit [Tenuifilaceae bacterium]